jgi:hypothetical protein
MISPVGSDWTVGFESRLESSIHGMTTTFIYYVRRFRVVFSEAII